jgi:hypothetical protein
MGEIKAFKPVKLICGLIYSRETILERAVGKLTEKFGQVDLQSPSFPFSLTDYYESQMGKNLERRFLSFQQLISPENLPQIKIESNNLEDEFKSTFPDVERPVNLDPGYLTASALIMATTKDFTHRIPLSGGIYAHLELLFTKKGIKLLDWTYPDFHQSGYQEFFLKVREIYLFQLRRAAEKT